MNRSVIRTQTSMNEQVLQAELLTLAEMVKQYTAIVADPERLVQSRKEAAVKLLEAERRLNDVWFQLHFE